jgi:adenylate kinase
MVVRLAILGGSGAGKSTQAQGICKYFDLPLVSNSEILQDAIGQGTVPSAAVLPEEMSHRTITLFSRPIEVNPLPNLSHLTQSYLETEELISDTMMNESIRNRLNKPEFNSGWVLEGYPRTAFQAEELDLLLENLGQNLDWAIYLQVPQAVMVSRSLGRCPPDDQPEIVQRRVEIFYDCTIPILEYYDRRRRLLTINGDQPPEAVQQNIVTLLSTPE